ncbi:MAG: ester cyclase [Terracidiphilus sp.]
MKRTMVFLLLIIAPAWAATKPAPASSSPAIHSQQEQNKAVARRVFEEIFNQGKFQVADEIYSKDFVNHGEHTDWDLAKDQAAARFEKQACPDITITIGQIVAEGDLVSVLWIARGTNTARVGWMPATGVKIELRGITIWRIVDGKIREEWTSANELRIVRELAYQLRWQLFGLLCVALILLWIVYRLIGKLFIRRSSLARAWDSRG